MPELSPEQRAKLLAYAQRQVRQETLYPSDAPNTRRSPPGPGSSLGDFMEFRQNSLGDLGRMEPQTSEETAEAASGASTGLQIAGGVAGFGGVLSRLASAARAGLGPLARETVGLGLRGTAGAGIGAAVGSVPLPVVGKLGPQQGAFIGGSYALGRNPGGLGPLFKHGANVSRLKGILDRVGLGRAAGAVDDVAGFPGSAANLSGVGRLRLIQRLRELAKSGVTLSPQQQSIARSVRLQRATLPAAETAAPRVSSLGTARTPTTSIAPGRVTPTTSPSLNPQQQGIAEAVQRARAGRALAPTPGAAAAPRGAPLPGVGSIEGAPGAARASVSAPAVDTAGELQRAQRILEASQSQGAAQRGGRKLLNTALEAGGGRGPGAGMQAQGSFDPAAAASRGQALARQTPGGLPISGAAPGSAEEIAFKLNQIASQPGGQAKVKQFLASMVPETRAAIEAVLQAASPGF